jgi:hypothetical protein
MTMILIILSVHVNGQIILVEKISYMWDTKGLESPPGNKYNK